MQFRASSRLTRPWLTASRGVAQFIRVYAPSALNSPEQFRSHIAVGIPMKFLTSGEEQFELATDPLAETNYYAPKRALISIYQDTLRKHGLDGFVYPALQVPVNDKRKELPKDLPNDGPYSRMDWVNCIGVPAVVLPAGFYESGMPFGIEMSANYGRDGELIGYPYAYQQADTRGLTICTPAIAAYFAVNVR